MTDPILEARLRHLAAEEVPDAPWLEDRVLAAVSSDAWGPQRRRARFALAAAAAAVIAALGVGVLLGTRLIASPSSAEHVTPSRSADIVGYRDLIDADLRTVDHADAGKCNSRNQCILTLEQTRTATFQLLNDVSGNQAPPSVAARADAIRVAVSKLILQLDVAISVASQPSSDYRAASAVPDVAQLDLAVAELDCWPAAPILEGHGIACS